MGATITRMVVRVCFDYSTSNSSELILQLRRLLVRNTTSVADGVFAMVLFETDCELQTYKRGNTWILT